MVLRTFASYSVESSRLGLLLTPVSSNQWSTIRTEVQVSLLNNLIRREGGPIRYSGLTTRMAIFNSQLWCAHPPLCSSPWMSTSKRRWGMKIWKILLEGENGQLNQFTVMHTEVEVKIVR